MLIGGFETKDRERDNLISHIFVLNKRQFHSFLHLTVVLIEDADNKSYKALKVCSPYLSSSLPQFSAATIFDMSEYIYVRETLGDHYGELLSGRTCI